MRLAPTCPRCFGAVRPPDLWSSAWRCETHGEVQPFRLIGRLAPEGMAAVVQDARVPVWVPHPMMPGWVVTGLGTCGDDRVGARATLVCCSGPAPLGGPADLMLVAEEPGVGLGAHLAGLDGPDPGDLSGRAPDAKMEAAGHPTAMWSVPTTSRSDASATFVGEARALWIWAVLWPASAGVLFLDHVALADAREFGPAAYEMLGYGALSPRLHGKPAQDG